MTLPDRKYSSGKGYRFGFNGMENDDEVKGKGNSLDFGARIYDSRIGRWLSTDPLQAKYAGWSPYNFVLNNPINLIDPDGLEAKPPKRSTTLQIEISNDGNTDTIVETKTTIIYTSYTINPRKEYTYKHYKKFNEIGRLFREKYQAKKGHDYYHDEITIEQTTTIIETTTITINNEANDDLFEVASTIHKSEKSTNYKITAGYNDTYHQGYDMHYPSTTHINENESEILSNDNISKHMKALQVLALQERNKIGGQPLTLMNDFETGNRNGEVIVGGVAGAASTLLTKDPGVGAATGAGVAYLLSESEVFDGSNGCVNCNKLYLFPRYNGNLNNFFDGDDTIRRVKKIEKNFEE